jgi:hypothetical protein
MMPSASFLSSLLLVGCLLLDDRPKVQAFTPSKLLFSSHQRLVSRHEESAQEQKNHHLSMVANLRDADFVEQMIGGERFEMVPLPDSMVDTTLFVGNLNEFVHDDDLSDFFRPVTTLQSVPACVVRRPNMDSLEYGFVSFPSIEEKEVSTLYLLVCMKSSLLDRKRGLVLILFMSIFPNSFRRQFYAFTAQTGKEKFSK